MPDASKPVVVIVRDGWGHNPHPEHDAFNDRTAQGGFWVPPALQKHMVELRASKLSPEQQERFTPFPFEK